VVIGVVLEISIEKSYCCIGYIQSRALAYVVLWNISREVSIVVVLYSRVVFVVVFLVKQQQELLIP
jgi:hypothetical protein